jgi:hypothetical protein
MGSLGAPVSLVLRMRNVSLTKRHQSTRAFAVAAHLGGAPVRPRRPVTPGRLPRDLPSLTGQLAIEGALSGDYAHRYAELAGWMCTRPPLSSAWSEIAAGEASVRDATWASLQWLATVHGAAVEPALRRVLRDVAEREAPAAIPWWLDGQQRRTAGVLPRHSELELFALARRGLQDRLEALVGSRPPAPVNAVLEPGG